MAVDALPDQDYDIIFEGKLPNDFAAGEMGDLVSRIGTLADSAAALATHLRRDPEIRDAIVRAAEEQRYDEPFDFSPRQGEVGNPTVREVKYGSDFVAVLAVAADLATLVGLGIAVYNQANSASKRIPAPGLAAAKTDSARKDRRAAVKKTKAAAQYPGVAGTTATAQNESDKVLRAIAIILATGVAISIARRR